MQLKISLIRKKVKKLQHYCYIVTFYITKYLNRKINYDILIQFSKGAEFKKVFYSYFKAVKVLIKRNNEKNKEFVTKNCVKSCKLILIL